jgi:hypothetical protein
MEIARLYKQAGDDEKVLDSNWSRYFCGKAMSRKPGGRRRGAVAPTGRGWFSPPDAKIVTPRIPRSFIRRGSNHS